MNRFFYYLIRFGLLLVVIVLGLVVFAPQVLDLTAVWKSGVTLRSDANQERLSKLADNYKSRSADLQQMTTAINTDLAAVKYVFGKNELRYQADKSWWPSVYSLAVDAQKLDTFAYFLEQGFECGFANQQYGRPAFESAIMAPDDRYLKALIDHGCEYQTPAFKSSLVELVAQSGRAERLQVLFPLSKNSAKSEPSSVYSERPTPRVSRILCTQNLDRWFIDETVESTITELKGPGPKVFINRMPTVFNGRDVEQNLTFSVYTLGLDSVKLRYMNYLSSDKKNNIIEPALTKNWTQFEIAADHHGLSEVAARGYVGGKLVVRDFVEFCIPRKAQ